MIKDEEEFHLWVDKIKEATQAKAVIVIVMGMDDGKGGMAATHDPDYALKIPKILRDLATQFEGTQQKGHA